MEAQPAPFNQEPLLQEPYFAESPKSGRRARKQQKALEAEKRAQMQAISIWDADDRPKEEVPFSLSDSLTALLGGAVGGLPGGAAWIVAVALIGMPLPYLCTLLGILAGLGARFAVTQTRPLLLGLFAALGAAVAFVVTQYGLLDYALVQANLQQHSITTTWFPLAPTAFPGVYWDYINGLPDAVTRAIGDTQAHSSPPLGTLVAMGLAWLMLIRRKR